MIPKTIHFCWFSKEKYPPKIKKCIHSWEKLQPEYKIRLWDANSFTINSNPFTKRCFELKKWAYVADYIRLYALYTEGGIYLDSDVMVFKPFDSLLNCNAFWGIDAMKEHDYAFPEAAVFGAQKGFEPLKEMMDYYHKLPTSAITTERFAELTNVWDSKNRSIYDLSGNLQLVTAPVVMESVLKKYGFCQKDKNQTLKNDINIYSSPKIQNHNTIDTEETIAHHMNASSWFFTNRGPVFKFCHDHPFWMPLYKSIESLHK